MRSRRDQLQAYQFLRRRIVAALLSGEPDSPEAPMRRIVRTAFAGTMIAVMVAAVFGVIGVVKKGGATSWQKDNAIVVDKDSNALYVWAPSVDGGPRQLHPMLNLTSARLFLSGGVIKKVSSKSLAGIPRTPLQGIADAPLTLPKAKDLIRGPWTVCARPRSGGPEVSVLAGVRPPGVALDTGDGALVAGTSGLRKYVVWKGVRHLIRDARVLPSLGFTSSTPSLVSDAWVSALPEGTPLDFPQIPNAGQASVQVAGRTAHVGDVFDVTDLGQYTVALGSGLTGGLAPVSEVVALLLLTDQPGGGTTAVKLTNSAYTAAQRIDAPADLSAYPEHKLKPATGDVLCTSTSGSPGKSTPQTVYAGGALPGGIQLANLRGRVSDGQALADTAFIPGGGGALVRGDGTNPTRYLITDVGKKFPIGDDEALKALGYDSARVASVPEQFLGLLPLGPSLSRDAAAQQAT